MAQLKYLKASKNGFPDSKGSLSNAKPSQAVVEAHQKIQQLYHMQMQGSKDLLKGTSVFVHLF